MKPRNIVILWLLICLTGIFVGCSSGTRYEVHKNLLDNNAILSANYSAVIWAPTSLYSLNVQMLLLNMLDELMDQLHLIDKKKGKYYLVLKVLEYNKVDSSARRASGMFAGTDFIKAQITVINEDLIDRAKFAEILAEKKNVDKFVDRNTQLSEYMRNSSELAKTLMEMHEAHVFQGTIEKYDRSPGVLILEKFLRNYAKEIIKWLHGTK